MRPRDLAATPLTPEQRALAESNLPWAYRVASRFRGAVRRPLWEDLRQAAALGLARAAARFDPGRPGAAKFTHYSKFWIRKEIHAFLDRTPWGPIGTPLKAGEVLNRLRRDGAVPASQAGIARACARARRGAIPIGELAPSTLEQHFADDPRGCSTVEAAIAGERADSIAAGLRAIRATPRAIGFAVKSYRLDGCMPLTYAEIGRESGMTGEGVRLNVSRVIDRLREIKHLDGA